MLMWKCPRTLSLLAAGTLVGFVGCSGGSTVPKLAPVTGVVSIEGTPTAGVTVIFTPMGDTKTTGGSGVTVADGKFELLHRSGKPGVEPGQYAVTFSRMVLRDGSPIPAGKSPIEVDAKESIPGRFQDPSNPAHTATVSPEGGSFEFGIGAPKK